MANAELTGIQKAAVLLITLGPEKSASIFKHLKEEEIEELTLEIANTRSISPQEKEDVLNEFYQVCLAQQYIAEGGIGYAKELLEKALGEQKAQDVITKLTASLQVRPFEFIRKTDPSQVLNFIQDEHPQTIAMILSYLSPAQSAMILGALTPEKQADVAKRIAMMDRTSPDVIKEVERVLETKAVILIKSGLHNRRWRRCDRRYFEYGRPRNRKAYHGISRNRSSLNLLMRSVRKCSYSKISFFSTTVQSSVCCVTLITMTLVSHSKVPMKKYRMLSLRTCPSVCLL